jgi:hypothetical protein
MARAAIELLRIARAVFSTPGALPAASNGQAAASGVTLADAARHVIESEIQDLKHRALVSLLMNDDWPGTG